MRRVTLVSWPESHSCRVRLLGRGLPLRPLSSPAGSVDIGRVQIFQYDICPFCNKIKALLDLQRVKHEAIEVNPLTKSEIKSWSAGYRKVPIAMIDGEQVNDSPVIASMLFDRMKEAGIVSDDFCSPEALKWAEWSDSKLAVLLFPNITRSFGESYQAFSYVHAVQSFSLADKWSNQLIGSLFMWLAQGKIKKKYGIDDERAAVLESLRHWIKEGVGEGPFAGGSEPNFADCCVFGCLKAIDRTSTFQELQDEGSIQPWFSRMKVLVDPGNACVRR